jgi:hypothetical protein
MKKFYENTYIIFENMVNKKTNIKRLTNILQDYLDSECIKDLYIYILSKNNDNVTEKISEEFFLKYLINYLNQLNEEKIYCLIKSCSKNKYFLSTIFNSIENLAISENDFYNNKDSGNIKLYELLSIKGYNNNFSNTKYFESSNNFRRKFLVKLEKLNVPYLKILNIIENDSFLSKLILIADNE